MIGAATLVRQARAITGESLRAFARRVGTSAPTLSDYENAKRVPGLPTLSRILERAGMELRLEAFPRLSVTERLALELHRRVADHLRHDPALVRGVARKNLDVLRRTNAGEHAAPYIAEWERVLSEPDETVCELLVSTQQRYRDLRSVSVFAGVLSQRERLDVIDRFGWAAEKRRCAATSSSTS